ncbi:MAG: DUF3014 domain-containing protein [Candidatus Aminicenantes bacterium]|nr:DUF3014 domain-containing protein [Candidatus Aminicenantes bacterium]
MFESQSDDLFEEEPRGDERRKVVRTGLLIFVFLAVLAGLYYFLIYRKGRPAAEEVKPAGVVSQPAESPAGDEAADLLKLPPLELDRSDDLLRQLIQGLSSHPRLPVWLRTSEIIRKFVAAVDNIANGISPKSQVDFFAPSGRFKVARRDGRTVIDPTSYDRYTAVADVFITIDTPAAARLYRSLRPLIGEAYRDLGYPGQNFDDTLLRAFVELLDVPIVEGRVPVDRTVTNYVYLDPSLEGLSQAQKQFLRFGPENVQVIQTKLREMAQALGFPEGRLPKSRFYTPSGGR